jgi:hypothetical protein
MTGKLQWARRTVQAVSFFFLLYLILQAAFPLEVRIPVDLYLRLDPFIAIVAFLTQGEIIIRMLPALGVLLLVMIFGNFFPEKAPLRDFYFRPGCGAPGAAGSLPPGPHQPDDPDPGHCLLPARGLHL